MAQEDIGKFWINLDLIWREFLIILSRTLTYLYVNKVLKDKIINGVIEH